MKMRIALVAIVATLLTATVSMIPTQIGWSVMPETIVSGASALATTSEETPEELATSEVSATQKSTLKRVYDFVEGTIDNPFTKAILFPITFAIFGALFQGLANLSRGLVTDDKFKYRVWLSQEEEGQQRNIARPNVTLNTIRTRADMNIIDIETGMKFSLQSFASIGLSLALGAFAVDVSATTKANVDAQILSMAFLVHVGTLCGVLLSLFFINSVDPKNRIIRTLWSLAAITIGMAAMMVSFLALYSGQ